jgi:hypothetical protein
MRTMNETDALNTTTEDPQEQAEFRRCDAKSALHELECLSEMLNSLGRLRDGEDAISLRVFGWVGKRIFEDVIHITDFMAH